MNPICVVPAGSVAITVAVPPLCNPVEIYVGVAPLLFCLSLIHVNLSEISYIHSEAYQAGELKIYGDSADYSKATETYNYATNPEKFESVIELVQVSASFLTFLAPLTACAWCYSGS